MSKTNKSGENLYFLNSKSLEDRASSTAAIIFNLVAHANSMDQLDQGQTLSICQKQINLGNTVGPLRKVPRCFLVPCSNRLDDWHFILYNIGS